MTEKEITEGNKLIAQFMDLDWQNEIIHFINDEGEFYYSDQRKMEVTDLEYHKSWDWLMPVCKKIASEDDVMRYKVGELISNYKFEIFDIFKSIVRHIERKG